jgi:hypothetical protein
MFLEAAVTMVVVMAHVIYYYTNEKGRPLADGKLNINSHSAKRGGTGNYTGLKRPPFFS